MVKATTKTSDLRQAEPEYSQTSYLRMRSTEEAYQIYNYLDPEKNNIIPPPLTTGLWCQR